jgi:hypothetical protein
LQGFISDGDTVLVDEQLVSLTKDTLVIFAFFREDPPEPITIKWTAELNCAYYPLDSVVITIKSNNEKTTIYYPDTVSTYSFSEYGDTLVLHGFITVNDTFQIDEHIIPLTKDTFITFVFFNENALDTSEGIITDLLIRSRGDTMPYYFKYSYNKPLSFPDYRFMLINTQSHLDSLFAWDSSFVLPVVNFSTQTLILIQGHTPDIIVPDAAQHFSIIKHCSGNYAINMEILTGDLNLRDEFYWLLIVDEVILSEEQVKLTIDITPSNTPIKICGMDDPLNELQWLKEIISDSLSLWYPEYVYQCLYKNGIGFILAFASDYWELVDCEGIYLCTALTVAGHVCPQYSIDRWTLKHIWNRK